MGRIGIRQSPIHMRVYYLQRPLNQEELEFAQEAFQEAIEQVRIPFVLPTPDPINEFADRPVFDDKLLTKHLRSVGINRDRETQVALVVPDEFHYSTSIVKAIRNETVYYPYIIQTADQRAAINNPGSIRILNPGVGLEQVFEAPNIYDPLNYRFEWDVEKARSNRIKHGVSFDEATTVFDDLLARIFDDKVHSADERREIIVGHSIMNRLLVVCFIERPNERIRIINARLPTAKERKAYEQSI